MRNKALLLAFLLLFLFSFCACSSQEGAGSSPAESTAPKDSVIIVLPTSAEPEAGFDPIYGWGAGEHVHEPLIQSTLTVTDQELEIAYDLATELSVSEDGLIWTAKLRQDACFSDGQPLTAEDVVFTYNTARQESTVNDFTMLEQAIATDDFTVEFHLNQPYSIWPYTMAHLGIVPAHAYDADYGHAPIGSGRYLLSQWDRGQQLILTANPNYYGEEVQMKKVVVLFMEEDAALAAVRAGQVDLAYTAATYSQQQMAGYQLFSCKTVDNRGINLPARAFDGSKGNDLTADPLVRRAINLGLDRQQIIEHVLNGYGSPAYSVCDGMPWYTPANEVSHDPEAAKALLEQAGWLPGESGLRSKDGVPAELKLLYPVGDSLRQALAAETANQLLSLGISSGIEAVGWDVAYDRAQSEPMVWGWGAHTPMELYNIYHTVPGEEDAAYSPYSNPQVDAYMDQALRSADWQESYALWQAAQWDGEQGLAGDLPWIWLVNVDHLYWLREGLQVSEQKLHPHGHGWSIVNSVDQWCWQAE
ncbi:MAG: ABC transporter substrate-binding protein [Firmicutes bacterium]|nr:ABC transporter substrate-binding protein [Bacillota bacterium]